MTTCSTGSISGGGVGGDFALANGHDKADALLLQDALQPADGVALVVQQVLDAAQKVDVVRAIVAPATAPLQRLYFAKAGLPETQHVLRQVEIVGDLADGAECIRALVHGSHRIVVVPAQVMPAARWLA